MRQTFEFLDGKLCLRCEDTQSDEPVAIIAHYPFGRFYLSDCEHLIGQPAVTMGNGVYGCYLNSQCLEFRLESGGATIPVKFEKVPLDKPASKRDVRWHYGKWELRFATGWKTYVAR